MTQYKQEECNFIHTGLMHWGEDSDPWLEHARYAPSCEYVLMAHGLEAGNRRATTSKEQVYTLHCPLFRMKQT